MSSLTQVSILVAFNDKKIKGTRPKITDFILEETIYKHQEAAFHMISLKKQGLLKFTEYPFRPGGQTHPVYKNDAIEFDPDKIDITDNGQRYLLSKATQ